MGLDFSGEAASSESMRALRAALPQLTSAYANAAAVAAADWFRERAADAGNAAAAADEWLPDDGVGDLDGALGANYSRAMRTASPDQGWFADALADDLARRVRRQQARATIGLADRNGLEWAWVPHGDTCVFCLALASNGWQRTTWARAGRYADHVHTNCDCTIQVRFSETDGVEGYDPDALYGRYRDAGERAAEAGRPRSSREAVNQMRRDAYASDRDRINAQHRAAYARRRASEERTS